MKTLFKYLVIFSLQFIDSQMIGGTEDEYGCIINAGYEWCEKEQKCYRSWEESCGTEYCLESKNKICNLVCEDPICPRNNCAVRLDNCCEYNCSRHSFVLNKFDKN